MYQIELVDIPSPPHRTALVWDSRIGVMISMGQISPMFKQVQHWKHHGKMMDISIMVGNACLSMEDEWQTYPLFIFCKSYDFVYFLVTRFAATYPSVLSLARSLQQATKAVPFYHLSLITVKHMDKRINVTQSYSFKFC